MLLPADNFGWRNSGAKDLPIVANYTLVIGVLLVLIIAIPEVLICCLITTI
jgi:hypothetical protein